MVDMVVEPQGVIAGRTVEDAGLRNLSGSFLASLDREGELIAPVTPETVLHADRSIALRRQVGRRSPIFRA